MKGQVEPRGREVFWGKWKPGLPRLACFILAFLFFPFPGSATEWTSKWSLWAQGTLLRGANIYQRRVYPELDGPQFMGPGPLGPPYSQEDLDRLSAMGANYVNISHPGLFAEAPPYGLDPSVEENLDALLEKVARADMFAVISFRTGPGRSEFTFFWDEVGDWFGPEYLNDTVWQDQTAQDAWVAMWQYAAQRYRDHPIVVGYDLMVEPNANEVGSDALKDRLDIWDPEEFYAIYGGRLYDWNQLYPRIVAAIRSVDPDTPILVGGMGYSSVEWLPYVKLTEDKKTVYAIHQYAPYVYTHQEPSDGKTYPGYFDTDWDGKPELFNKAWLQDFFSPLDAFMEAHGVPVAANEFGVVRWAPGAAEFMNAQMDLFEERGINYALWLWETSWDPYAKEVHAFNFRHGPDPAHHKDVPSSALMEAIVDHWGRNTIRPSSFRPCGEPPARIPGNPPVYYDSVQEALEAAGEGDTIQVRTGPWEGSWELSRDVSISLEGGFDCRYASEASVTTLIGTLTVSEGCLCVQDLVLRGP